LYNHGERCGRTNLSGVFWLKAVRRPPRGIPLAYARSSAKFGTRSRDRRQRPGSEAPRVDSWLTPLLKHYAESVSDGELRSMGDSLSEREKRMAAAGDSTIEEVLADGTKVKRRKLRMRACNELNAKGKLCAGHLKRWYQPTGAAAARFGMKAELYRCERCRTVYLPNPDEAPRTGTLVW
jgi:hypothetical protein